jgi:uncharacterized protein with ParB-like and HNH nuclease domain
MTKIISDSVNALVKRLTNKHEMFVLPSLQRPYVWNEKQIYKLFDSIMKDYPLGTLLVWKTKRDVISRSFIEHWDDNSSKPKLLESGIKNMVLDGQQRLQSLLIGMRGTHKGRQLYFNVTVDPERLQVEKDVDGGLTYIFKFYKDIKKIPMGYISVKNLCESNEKSINKLADKIIADSKGDKKIDEIYKDRIILNIETFRHQFLTHTQAMNYNLIDEESNGLIEKTDDEIVEIFIRANSGGTKLNKSDLLFSLLSTGWGDAYEEIKEIENDLSSAGFDFSKDYILKAILICTDQGAAYQVAKFKKTGALEKVQNSWIDVRSSIFDVITFLKENTPVQSKKALVSQNSLLPIIAMRYKMGKKKWGGMDKIPLSDYILTTSLAGSFNGAKDTLLDKLTESMIEGFDLEKIKEIFINDNRSITFDAKKIWEIGYSNPEKVYFAMKNIIPGVSLSDISAKNIDHIIPRDGLVKLTKKIPASEINQLANLTILDATQNKQKSGRPLKIWLEELDPSERANYLARNCIPAEPSLWDPNNFHQFVEERKKLILSKTELGKLIPSKVDTIIEEIAYDVEDL